MTQGDRVQTGPVIDLGGKGVWVKEIEEGLLAGEIDVAVHSMKDVPAELAPGLAIVAVPDARRSARRNRQPRRRRAGGAAGGQPRRHVQPAARLPGPRGARRSVDRDPARQRRHAPAQGRRGRRRRGGARVSGPRPPRFLGAHRRASRPTRMLPAIGQGALALESRADDTRVVKLCRALADAAAEVTTTAERALLAGLGVGCRTPVAGHATLAEGRLTITGLVGRPDASEMIREALTGAPADAAAMGAELARRLLARGADRILRELEM